MTATLLSSRGQVVIPAQVRRMLGLVTGDQLRVSVSEDGSEIRLRRQESLTEMADRLSSYARPGVEPLLDSRAYYEQREPRP